MLVGRVTAPHMMLIESTKVHNAIQRRSTDPKNSGAKASAATVAQSWIDLNVCTAPSIATSASPTPRHVPFCYQRVFVAAFTPVTALAVFEVVLAVLLMRVNSL